MELGFIMGFLIYKFKELVLTLIRLQMGSMFQEPFSQTYNLEYWTASKEVHWARSLSQIILYLVRKEQVITGRKDTMDKALKLWAQ